MPRRGGLMLLVTALFIGIIPTAYANPPDPSWVAGYWDDDDFDNTVVFITGPCAIHVTVPVHARALLVAMGRLEPREPADCPTPLERTSLRPRAPPRQLPRVCA